MRDAKHSGRTRRGREGNGLVCLEENLRGWKQHKSSGWRAGDKTQSEEVEGGAVDQAGCPDVGKLRCCASLPG